MSRTSSTRSIETCPYPPVRREVRIRGFIALSYRGNQLHDIASCGNDDGWVIMEWLFTSTRKGGGTMDLVLLDIVDTLEIVPT